ncbi:AAA family ATPase [Palleronia caenipelagi]|uniref:AAA family ATPase n=1 Tax=Palleronia caenipelagi TaxID=2489174 RepID=A0A547PN70_9RHOB|nr:AAA family ATPase [Palleronia caenipelagi]TRD15474.1 AAA family ATPase [Palleronia caenipelagi]
MNTHPFGVRAPIYLLCGLTDDEFVLGDTRIVTLETAIEEHLRALGFDQVAFHYTNDGIREVNLTVTEGPAGDPAPEASAPARPSRLVDGPMGRTRLTRRTVDTSSTPRTPVTPDDRHGSSRQVTRLSDADLPAYLRGFLRQRNGRRAIVFTDADFLLSGVDQSSLRNLQSFLRDFARSRVRNAICVFVSAHAGPAAFRAADDNAQHFFHSLRDHLFLATGTPRDNVLRIGPPEKDELLNLQRRLRLQEGLATNFDVLDSNLDALMSEIRSATAANHEIPDIRSMSVFANFEHIGEWNWTVAPNTSDALEELGRMHGRWAVSDRLHNDIEDARYILSQSALPARAAQPDNTVARLVSRKPTAPPHPIDLNYALVGRPGTGKTVIARLFGQAFKEAGLLPSGHFIEAKASDFVAGYLGQSEEKATALLDSAIGGTIFIDEVQNFEPDNQFHRTVVKQLLTYLENRRGEVSVIFATYPEHFDAFLNFDPGLERRITQKIVLEDYSGAESAEIFRGMAKERNLVLDDALDAVIEDLFDNWIYAREAKPAFANGGSVRKLIEEMQKPARRNGGVLLLDHVPEPQRPYLKATGRSNRGEDALAAALDELNGLVGLDELKTRVAGLVTMVQAAKKRGEAIPEGPGHFSFEGAPGTGKTTAARLMGQIFRNIGLLKSGHVEEADRQKLVAGYQGQTAIQVDEIVNRALDGVLFIDEAHNLATDERDPYGKEAIGTLTNRIENNRHRLCVILAGYSEPMNRLFAQDPGWDSRIGTRIAFANYTPVETAEIIRLFVASSNRTLAADLDAMLVEVARRLIEAEGEAFANGRSARNLVKAMMVSLDDRFIADDSVDPHQIILTDLPVHLRQ